MKRTLFKEVDKLPDGSLTKPLKDWAEKEALAMIREDKKRF